MSIENLSLSAAHGDLAATGFLGALAFAVTIMLAGFAIEALAGLLTSALRPARGVLAVLAVAALLAGAVFAAVGGF